MDIKDIKKIVRDEITESIFQLQDFLLVGNWKMNKTKQEIIDFLNVIVNHDFGEKNSIIVIPSSPYLYLFEEKLRYSKIQYGVQNFYPKDEGAFTGEISIQMVKDFGCKYAIVGHSERRNIFFECDAFTSKKIKACIENKIIPILCIGEHLEQRKNGEYKKILVDQIREDLSKVSGDELSTVIIAYEPIWAIGTGETASPEQVEETHIFLRNFLIEEYGNEIGNNIPLLYGGSVKPSNIKELALAQSVSGFLIGGASLDAQALIEMSNILDGK